jgi:CxxC motif-containing protein (DUF1111 family)
MQLAVAAGWFTLACAAPEPKVFSAPPFDPLDEGNDTIAVVSASPGTPVFGLSNRQRQLFARGLLVFDDSFSSVRGLGPLFNSASCGECHEDPVLGGPGDEVEVHVSNFTGSSCETLDALGGPVVQQDAIPELQDLGIVSEDTPQGATGTGLRSTPAVFGMGLLDAVSDQTIKAIARLRWPDGVHGRAAILPDGRVGRFGRKATTARLFDFNAGAFFNEMGVTNPLNPVEGTNAGKPLPPNVDLAPDPELDAASLEATDMFVRVLSPVAPLPLTGEARRGRQLFRQVRCTSCHLPVLITGNASIRALRFRLFRAYSDLLLHDLGDENADMCNGVANPNEFRTQPLMGIRFQEAFMHDGASETIQDAIQRHGGEASVIRDRFFGLTPSDQAAVVAFVLSL